MRASRSSIVLTRAVIAVRSTIVLTRSAILLTLLAFAQGCGQSAEDRRSISVDLEEAARHLSLETPGGIASADSLYRGILARDESNAEARFGLGRAELLSGRTWAGLWHMTRLLRDQPSHAGALRARGLQAYSEMRYDDAFASLDALSKVRELDRTEAIALGDAQNHTNRFTAADSTFAAAITKFGEDPRALEAWGYTISKLGDLEKATVPLSRAIELDPKLGSARLALATVLQDLDRFEESEKVLAAAPSAPADSATYETLFAKARERAGDLESAHRHLQNAIRIDPGDEDAHYVLSQILRRRNDLEGAKAAAARHQQVIRDAERRTGTYALTALVDGAIAEEKGDVSKALAIYRDGLEVHPGHTMLRCALEPHTAAAAQSPSADLGPQHFLETGKELRRRGLPKVALRQFEYVTSRMPQNEEALYFQALTLSEMGDWNAALRIAKPLEQKKTAGPRT